MIAFAQSDDTDDVTNTVDLTRVQFIIAYYDMSGVVKYYTKFLDSNGRFAMTDTPSDYASLIGYYVRIYGGALPTATGNYSISVRFVSELSGYEYKAMTLYSIKSIGNSISTLNSVTPTWWADGAGGFTANSTVSINSGVSYIQLNSTVTGLYAEAGGRIFINFTPVSTSNVELESPTVSDSDTLADISGNTSSLVDSLDEANGTLQEIIQTISNQLAAFWDQLYNYVHLEQLANDNANTDKLINNDNANTSELIENQDENTEEIVNSLDENTNTIVDKLEDTKTGIISGIIDGLKGLFIPSEDYFQTKFNELNEFFSERLGLLYTPFEIIINLVDIYLNAGVTDATLIFPGFSIMGHQVWPDIPFNLTEFLESNFSILLSACRIGTSVIIVFNFLHLVEVTYRKVVDG